ncbi:MAG: hypothetical protein EBY26_03050, partial [Microbacteriaceae bacterium]|nr:hypothetical protein [Microbacteriaceae bacterium]
MRLVDLRDTELDSALVNSSVPRAPLDIDAALAQIRPLLDDIRARGLEPILEAAKKFDNLDPTPVRVQAHELATALDERVDDFLELRSGNAELQVFCTG